MQMLYYDNEYCVGLKCAFDWNPEMAAKKHALLQMDTGDDILDALR